MVGEPAGRDRPRAEGDEPAERERQELRVGPLPRRADREDRSREDQHGEVIEEVADVQEEVEAGGILHGSVIVPPRAPVGTLSGDNLYREPATARARITMPVAASAAADGGAIGEERTECGQRRGDDDMKGGEREEPGDEARE